MPSYINGSPPTASITPTFHFSINPEFSNNYEIVISEFDCKGLNFKDGLNIEFKITGKVYDNNHEEVFLEFSNDSLKLPMAKLVSDVIELGSFYFDFIRNSNLSNDKYNFIRRNFMLKLKIINNY